MKKKILAVSLVPMLAVLGGCFEQQESDLQKAINRDDALLQSYLSRNNISATETPLGYFYKNEISNDVGNQIVNNDVVGVYYEIKTIDGQLIDSYLDETLPPRLYHHQEGGLVPRGMNFASGLAKEGETFSLYIPSYLAFQDYSFQQLIQPQSNLVIKVKYVQAFDEEELEVIEEEMIEEHLQTNGLSGFIKKTEGPYIKVVKPGVAESKQSKTGDIVRFSYKLMQLDNQVPIAQSANNSPFQITLGNSNNLEFLNHSLKDVSKDMELDIIFPSHLGFGGSVQVFPFQIRKDFFEKSIINQIARPFEPLLFQVTILEVK